MPHDIRLFSDVSSKMSMFDQRAKEHRENQLINPFSEWSGAGTRRKMSRDDPDYGRPVEGSKTAERGRQAQVQMISDMVELCDFVYDCGIRCKDGRAAISFGDLFRLYSTINDKCVGLLMRGRKHKVLEFEGEMLFQRRDDHKMIELLLPLNTIRFKYGLPERMGAGEVRTDLLQQQEAAEEEARVARSKKQRARSLDMLPSEPPRHQKSSSVDASWSLAVVAPPERAVSQPDLNAACTTGHVTGDEEQRRLVHDGGQLETAEGGNSASSLFTISEEVPQSSLLAPAPPPSVVLTEPPIQQTGPVSSDSASFPVSSIPAVILTEPSSQPLPPDICFQQDQIPGYSTPDQQQTDLVVTLTEPDAPPEDQQPPPETSSIRPVDGMRSSVSVPNLALLGNSKEYYFT